MQEETWNDGGSILDLMPTPADNVGRLRVSIHPRLHLARNAPMSIHAIREKPATPRPRRSAAVLSLLTLTAAATWLGQPATLSPAADPTAKVEVPRELDLVPRDAAAFVHVRA